MHMELTSERKRCLIIETLSNHSFHNKFITKILSYHYKFIGLNGGFQLPFSSTSYLKRIHCKLFCGKLSTTHFTQLCMGVAEFGTTGNGSQMSLSLTLFPVNFYQLHGT